MPDQVERFSNQWPRDGLSREMTPDSEGGFVLYSDYEKLEAIEHDIRVRAEDRLERLDEAHQTIERISDEREAAKKLGSPEAIGKVLKQRDEELRRREDVGVDAMMAVFHEQTGTAPYPTLVAALKAALDSIVEEGDDAG